MNTYIYTETATCIDIYFGEQVSLTSICNIPRFNLRIIGSAEKFEFSVSIFVLCECHHRGSLALI